MKDGSTALRWIYSGSPPHTAGIARFSFSVSSVYKSESILMACVSSWHAHPHGMVACTSFVACTHSWHAHPHGTVACTFSWHAHPCDKYTFVACSSLWHGDMCILMACTYLWHAHPHGIVACTSSWHGGMHIHIPCLSFVACASSWHAHT